MPPADVRSGGWASTALVQRLSHEYRLQQWIIVGAYLAALFMVTAATFTHVPDPWPVLLTTMIIIPATLALLVLARRSTPGVDHPLVDPGRAAGVLAGALGHCSGTRTVLADPSTRCWNHDMLLHERVGDGSHRVSVCPPIPLTCRS
jgi:hypothetical protein